jgi:gluconokinase
VLNGKDEKTGWLPVFFMENKPMQPQGFLIMGVSGSGKSTLGRALAHELGWEFFDADDFHSVENIAKMSAGIPPTDSDRAPWLKVLNQLLLSTRMDAHHPMLAYSALKENYRNHLLAGVEGMAVIYLKGSYEEVRSRLMVREGHYMKENLLQSQFDALEEPKNAIFLDVSMPPGKMLDTIFMRYPNLDRSAK